MKAALKTTPRRAGLDVLIDQNRIPIRIDHHEIRRASGCFVGFRGELNSLALQLALQLANVGELVQLVAVLIPTGIEAQGVLLEHPLEESDLVVTVLENEPVLGGIPAHGLEAERLVE